MTWRERARKVIVRVIAEVGQDDPKKLKRALCEAYPFWEKENYPYKVWRDEIKRQLTTTAKPSRQVLKHQELEALGQQRLFL